MLREINDGKTKLPLSKMQGMIISLQDNVYKAFSIVCPHAGGYVEAGIGVDGKCGLHGAQFNLVTGKNTAGNWFQERGLYKFSSLIENGFLIIFIQQLNRENLNSKCNNCDKNRDCVNRYDLEW